MPCHRHNRYRWTKSKTTATATATAPVSIKGTFAAVPYEVGLDAVRELRDVFPGQENLATVALRWILENEAVSTVIPGASRIEQLDGDLAASDRAPLTVQQHAAIDPIYEARIKQLVHQLW